MSLVVNGTTIEKVICNGVEIDKVVCNGVTVWESATPFTLALTSYPISKTSSGGSIPDGETTAGGCNTTSSRYYISAKQGGASTAYGYCNASTSAIPTQGCNKVKITYSVNSWVTSASINGTDVSSKAGTTGNTLILSCGDTFTLNMSVTVANDTNWGTLQVTKVEFYSE